MINSNVLKAFQLLPYSNIQPLSAGLINHSYKITLHNNKAYFLQQLNTSIFKQPEWMQENYVLIYQHLSNKGGFQLPSIVPAGKELLYKNGTEAWRCFKFLSNTYSPEKVHTPEKAYDVA